MEQTVDGLLGLPQPEEQRSEWQRAWDELSDLRLEVQEEDTEGRIQRKRREAWAVNWEERRLLIMEFTRPNDRGELSLHETDTLKAVRYTPLRDHVIFGFFPANSHFFPRGLNHHFSALYNALQCWRD